MVSEGFASNPVGEHVEGLFSLVLGNHVSSTMDGGEGKSVVLLSIASDLSLDEEGPPLFRNSPVELSDPGEGAEGGDSSVGVSGVE